MNKLKGILTILTQFDETVTQEFLNHHTDDLKFSPYFNIIEGIALTETDFSVSNKLKTTVFFNSKNYENIDQAVDESIDHKDSPLYSQVIFANNEKELLKSFWKYLEKKEISQLIVFNENFDIPFLSVRTRINRIPKQESPLREQLERDILNSPYRPETYYSIMRNISFHYKVKFDSLDSVVRQVFPNLKHRPQYNWETKDGPQILNLLCEENTDKYDLYLFTIK